MPRPHFVVAALLVAALTSTARADIRLWEKDADDPAKHRYLDLTGFLQPGFIHRDNDANAPIGDDGFWVQRARFGFKAQLQRYLWVRLEQETTPNPVLQDAYVESRFKPWLNVRFGQFQLAFLRTFQFSEANLAFIDRTVYVPQSPDRPYLRYLSPRDIGLMLTGQFKTFACDVAPVIEYWVGAFLGQGPNQTRNLDSAYLYDVRVQAHLRGVPKGVEAESDLARNDTPKIAVAAGLYSNCDDRRQWNHGFTVDSELRWKGLFASAAFVRIQNSNAHGLGKTLGYGDFCTGVPGANGARKDLAVGANLQLQYVLPTRWFPWSGQALEALGRFDYVDPNSPDNGSLFGGGKNSKGYTPPPSYGDADNPPSSYRVTLGVNWFPTSEQNFRLSLNYQINRELEHVVTAAGELQGIHNDVLWLQLTAGL